MKRKPSVYTSFQRCGQSRLSAALVAAAALGAFAVPAHAVPDPVNIAPAAIPQEEEGPRLEGTISIAYESRYVASGAQSAYASVQPSIELSYGGFTAGIWANNPLDRKSGHADGPFGPEYQFFGGYSMDVTDLINAGVGFTYYSFSDEDATPNRTRELNLSLGLNMLLQPTLEYNYDFDLKQHDVAFIICYEHPLDEILPVAGLSVSAEALVGYLHADRPESDQGPANQSADGYFYTEVALNVNYVYNHVFCVSAGPRFAYNNNGDSNIAQRETNVWWGISTSISF